MTNRLALTLTLADVLIFDDHQGLVPTFVSRLGEPFIDFQRHKAFNLSGQLDFAPHFVDDLSPYYLETVAKSTFASDTILVVVFQNLDSFS